LVDVESARSVAYHAAWVAVHDQPDLDLTAAFAAAYCTEVSSRVTSTNIQVHGGIGFTWEHSAHLYLKRAKGSELISDRPGSTGALSRISSASRRGGLRPGPERRSA